MPFDSVDELMGSLEDLVMDQTRAAASVRLAGGMTTRSKEYQQTFRSRQVWGIMTVTADPFKDEANEFSRVCAIFREKGGFRRNDKLKTHTCTALLDTGRPASFIQEKVWLRMLACRAASEDDLSRVEEKHWGGFHGTTLITSRHVRLNVHLVNIGSISPSSTVCLVVNAHVVPRHSNVDRGFTRP